MKKQLSVLLEDIHAYTICEAELPLGPRPVVQFHPKASILIAAQAPGKKVHETGIPFNDPSGDRLRERIGMTRETFYNKRHIAILPMGFCYPGTGKSGDLPPRPECAATWRAPLLGHLPERRLTLVIGHYAQAYHLPNSTHKTVTKTVKAWKEFFHITSRFPIPAHAITYG